jgi:hypothetical protein
MVDCFCSFIVGLVVGLVIPEVKLFYLLLLCWLVGLMDDDGSCVVVLNDKGV